MFILCNTSLIPDSVSFFLVFSLSSANVVRSIGLSVSPLLVGYLLEKSDSFVFSLPFIIAGVLKCIYDVLLYWSFSSQSNDSSATSSYSAVPTTTSIQNDTTAMSKIDQQLADDEEELRRSLTRK